MRDTPELQKPKSIETFPNNRRLKFVITIEGEQGSGKSTAAEVIQAALQTFRMPYKDGEKFKVAVFDNGKMPTHEQLKERLTQDGSNVAVIVKQGY